MGLTCGGHGAKQSPRTRGFFWLGRHRTGAIPTHTCFRRLHALRRSAGRRVAPRAPRFRPPHSHRDRRCDADKSARGQPRHAATSPTARFISAHFHWRKSVPHPVTEYRCCCRGASMRPRSKTAENDRGSFKLSKVRSASMRPRSKTAENSVAGSRLRWLLHASMRPRSKTAENSRSSWRTSPARGASMRPRSKTAENLNDNNNPAALDIASMRPRSKTAENVRRRARDGG